MTQWASESTTLLIVIAVVVWSLQAAMGWIQMRAFNRLLQDLSARGRVVIGRSGHRWRGRTLVLICLDPRSTIIDACVLSGFTVFARARPLTELIGLATPLNETVLATLPRQIAEAVRVAFSMTDPKASVVDDAS